MRLLRILMFLFRLVFGVTYILSGFFKLTDPVGTGLIVEAYLNTLGLGFLRFGAVPFGMALSLTEFLIGIAILMCVRMRVAAVAGLVMNIFFTVLTFFLAYFDAIEECGCFGEAVQLTMWETFFKNVVLTVCIVPVFFFRRKFKPVAPVPAEWAFLGTYGVLALSCSLYSYVNIPLMDFGNFRVGTNLSAKIDDITNTDNFATVFIYEKDGRQEYFDLDSLPDTTWSYVSTESLYLGDEDNMLFDMTLSNHAGDIVTEDIVSSDVPVFIFTVLRPSELPESYWTKVTECMDSVAFRGGRTLVAVPAMDSVMEAVALRYPDVQRSLVFGDYKTLISMVRSNGGVMFIHNGVVVRKWAGWRFSPEDVSRSFRLDSEEVAARETIAQRLFYEVSILILFLVIVIFRYVCGIVYGGRFHGLSARERLRRRRRSARRAAKKILKQKGSNNGSEDGDASREQ